MIHIAHLTGQIYYRVRGLDSLWICSKRIRYWPIILTETERPLTVSIALSMIFVAVAYRTKGQFRRLRSTLNKLKSLKFRFGTRRPKGSKRAGQYFEPLKTLFKKEHPSSASGHLRCVISSNLKHY